MEAETKNKENWINLIKVIACILITNSHCRNIYPWYFLAIGGGFGNALFFGISGYLLANVKGSFGTWYLRRVKRIIPPVCLMAILDAVFLNHMGNVMSGSIWDSILYYSAKWWFVTAIMLYYLVFYFVVKYNFELGAFLSWLVGYFLIYTIWVDKTTFSVELEGLSPFKVYFYFGVMIAGALLRKHKAAISGKYRKMKVALIDVVALCVWTMVYGVIFALGTCYCIQFLIQMSVLVFAITTIILGWGIKIKSYRIIELISSSTLEIYLTQTTLGGFFVNYAFPINWILFWGTAFGGGIIIHVLVNVLFDRQTKIVRRGWK